VIISTVNCELNEPHSLEIGKWTNLLLPIAGVAAASASHSDVLLVDGLYSGANFVSAIISAWITAIIARPPDRRYPFGHDACGALSIKYRSMLLMAC